MRQAMEPKIPIQSDLRVTKLFFIGRRQCTNVKQILTNASLLQKYVSRFFFVRFCLDYILFNEQCDPEIMFWIILQGIPLDISEMQ